MRNNKFKIFIMLSLIATMILHVAGLKAQSLEPFNPYSSISPSAESWQMTKSGNLKPSLYTGAMEHVIPIYTYSDPEFTIPVGLNYSFDGYRPAQNSGTVGYGWYLDLGGVITREVRGLPDEEATENSHGRPQYGYWFSTRHTNGYGLHYSNVSNEFTDHERWATFSNSMGAGAVTREAALQLNPFSSVPTQVFISENGLYDYSLGLTADYPFYTNIGTSHYDMTPDIYHFNFLGHSGDFMLEPDGTVRVFNSDMPYGELEVEFDMSNMTPHSDLSPRLSGFTISDGKGYKYYFGMSFQTMEFSASRFTETNQNFQVPLSATAWRLRMIQAPNGRTVTFSYSSNKQVSRNSIPYYPPLKTGNGIHYPYTTGYLFSLTYSSVPESVEVDGRTVISLSYSNKQYDETSSTYFLHYPSDLNISTSTFRVSSSQQRLSSIRVVNNSNQTVDNITFQHSYASSGTPKMFLHSVTSTNKGTHQFSYRVNNISFPHNDTYETDHWGYWNYRGVTDIRNAATFSGSRYSQISGIQKDPNIEYAKSGALENITYPTGGYTSIIYEGNHASKCLDEDGALYEPSSHDLPIGGVRVSSMTDYSDSNDSGRTTSYAYDEGFLFHMPRYIASLPVYFRYRASNPTFDEYGNDSNIEGISSLNYQLTGYFPDSDYNVSRDCVHGYGKVTVTHPDGSYTENFFTNYNGSNSDVYSFDNTYFTFTKRGSFSHYDSFDIGYEDYMYPVIAVPTSDRKNMRGKLSSVVEKTSNGTIKERVEYQYIPDIVSLGHIYYNNLDSFISMPWECRSPLLSSKTQTTFHNDGGSTTVVTNYSYNNLGQITKQSSTDSSTGNSDQVLLRYTSETSPSLAPGLVVNVVNTKVLSNTASVVSAESYTYSSSTTGTAIAANPNPSSITQYHFSIPLSISALSPSTSAITSGMMSSISSGCSSSSYHSYSYDSKYRQTYASHPGGAYESYTWSGNNPVSKTVNGATTGYSWKDLVGLTAVSYPTGSSEAYSYDSGNRLEYIRNSSNNQVTRYQWYIGSGAYVNKVTYTSSGGRSSFSDKTWYDGLGYAVQENAVAASPSGKSIITPIVYDEMRRADAIAYLPYTASSGTSSFVQTSSAISSQATFYRNTLGDNHAYAVNDYEPWSGGMLISSRRPGDAWANGIHDISHLRRTNTSSDSVRKITHSPSSNNRIITSGYHTAGSLIVDIMSDEEGDESIVFTDAFGKKICTRQNNGSVNADTYYVYDLRDSLVCVIQPEGSALLSSNSTISFESDFAQKWFFTWKYDAWGNITEYHVPGGGTTTYAYDSRNRLISEKTPKLYNLGATRVMTYDDCDRPTTEKYRRDSNGRVIQTHSWTYYPFSSSAPAGSRGLLQSETVWEIPQSMSDSQNSLAYCTRNYNYDSEGRVTGIAESWSDGWSANVSTTYDFVGNVTSVTETHNGPMGYSQTINTYYTYDQRGRKLTCSRSVSGDETGDMTLATVTYSYDELGRPSGKTVIGANGSTLVDEDIDLDIHGWTTGITAKSNGSVPFFFENLSYTNPTRSISTARFDGNISEITSVHNTANANSSSLAIYSYNYDGMKRLTDARQTGLSPLLTESNKNTERNISYDRNGNITSLTRYDESGTPLALNFSNTGNRLTSVNGNSYSYDSAGNMTHDGRKGLDISYNCLNLPSHAETADGSSLTYTYLADGTKVSAMSGDGYGLKYRGSFVFDSNEYGDNTIQSIGWDEGRIALLNPPAEIEPISVAPFEEPVDSTVTDMPVYLVRDLYYVSDHLGNVRSVVDISPDLSEIVILEQNDYLPFGSNVQNTSYASISENRYRYANKEEQWIAGVDLSLLDFGARYYDPYIARWTSVDPMASDYSIYSPYNYCSLNPINKIDLYGKAAGDYYTYSGNYITSDNINDNKIYLTSDTAASNYYDSKSISDLRANSEEVDGIVFVYRTNNSNEATTGRFVAIGQNGFMGYTLERGGTPSTESGKCLPIPNGVYDTSERQEGKISNHFAFRIFNSEVPIQRGILGHIGNTTGNSKGCILFGTTENFSVNRVENSGTAMDKFETYFTNKDNIKLITLKCY